jgi:flagellar basal-body rod protein FlgC
MGWFPGIDISASGLYAQRVKLNQVANNIANINTTRSFSGGPYRRHEVLLKSEDNFSQHLSGLEATKTPLSLTHPRHMPSLDAIESESTRQRQGVEVDEVTEDTVTPFKTVYNPSHPDADKDGYVKLPNVDITQELTDMIIAKRAYEANVASINASKSMARTALDIGR